ncbi:hypothetical protein ACLOJK_015731 [Asimina triloba]
MFYYVGMAMKPGTATNILPSIETLEILKSGIGMQAASVFAQPTPMSFLRSFDASSTSPLPLPHTKHPAGISAVLPYRGIRKPFNDGRGKGRNSLQLGTASKYPQRKVAICEFLSRGGQNTGSCMKRQLSPVAVVGNATAASSEQTMEQSTFPSQEDDGAKHEDENQNDPESSVDHRVARVCDKLIEVFMVDKPTPTDWRKLLAFSRDWNNIRPHFYKRCQERADAEDNPGMQHKLLRLGRKLKEVDDDVQRHNELLEVIKGAPSEINAVVAKRRKDFTQEFFVHLINVAQSYHNNPAEQTALKDLGKTCLAAIQAYDAASEGIEALNAAKLKFNDIMNSPSVDVACKKIDALAEKNQLDSAMVLMITKAWSAAKESTMMEEEAKDILWHLYKTAIANLQRLLPKEVRILKYLLKIEDPKQRICVMKDAFTPGVEIEGKDVDILYTTPEKLLALITSVLDGFNFSREQTVIREAKDLLNPVIIPRLVELKKLLQDNFM